MSTIQNVLIRIFALIGQLWRFSIRSIGQTWQGFKQLAGLNNEGYFFDAEDSETPDPALPSNGTSIDARPTQSLPASTSNGSWPSTNSRSSSRTTSRSKGDMDYYRKMARQIKERS